MRSSVLVIALFASACASVAPAPPLPSYPPRTVSAPRPPPASVEPLVGDIPLGDWRAGRPAAVSAEFAGLIRARYRVGGPTTTALEDLRANGFSCGVVAAGPRTGMPAHSCRSSTREAGCAHTWQVQLFQTPQTTRLAEALGAYQRACGGDGLLGAPRG